ncbi:MAG: hypothetical protein R6V07_00150 [Armatimonadota bacterium]
MDAWRNPFAVLGISPRANAREITERARELIAIATSDEEKQAIVRARERLTQHPRVRAFHTLLEPSDATYGLGDWERFQRAFRRSPFSIGGLSRSAPDEWPADAFKLGPMTDISAPGVYPPRAACERVPPIAVELPDLQAPLSVRDLL